MEIRTHAREKRQADTKDLTSSSKIIRVLSSNLTDAPWLTSLMFYMVIPLKNQLMESHAWLLS